MVVISKWNGLTVPSGGSLTSDPTHYSTTKIDVNGTLHTGTPGTTWTSVWSTTVSGYDYGVLYFLKNDSASASIYHYYYLQVHIDGSLAYQSYGTTYEYATVVIKGEGAGSDYVAVGLNTATSIWQPIVFSSSLEFKVSPYWSSGNHYAYLFGHYHKMT